MKWEWAENYLIISATTNIVKVIYWRKLSVPVPVAPRPGVAATPAGQVVVDVEGRSSGHEEGEEEEEGGRSGGGKLVKKKKWRGIERRKVTGMKTCIADILVYQVVPVV